MLTVIRENVLVPLVGRVGTMVATALIGYGVQSATANQVAVGVVAFGLVLGDLLIDWINRRTIAKNAENRAWDEAKAVSDVLRRG